MKIEAGMELQLKFGIEADDDGDIYFVANTYDEMGKLDCSWSSDHLVTLFSLIDKSYASYVSPAEGKKTTADQGPGSLERFAEHTSGRSQSTPCRSS